MAGAFDKIRLSATKLETPTAIRHVESHLIFGPVSRHFPLVYVAGALVVASLIATVVTTKVWNAQHIGTLFDGLILFLVPAFMYPLTLRQQAIVGWMSVKMTFGIVAFMMATVGWAVSFQAGKSDAVPNLLLGLIWIPGIEFLPRVTPYQKYVTLARIVLSVPCVFFGLESGNWHW